MAGKITYIATPLGHLDAPHWRSVAAFPGGDTAIVIGIQLRDLAAQIHRGGRLVLPSGVPMTIPILAATLGREATQIEYALSLLAQVGTITRDDVTICVTDPVLLEHFQRTEALTLPDKKARKQALSAARSKKYRQRKKSNNITPPSRLRHAIERDESPQQADITCGIGRHDMFIEYIDISSPETPCDDGDDVPKRPDLTAILRDVPPYKVGQIQPLIYAALDAGHSLHSCQMAISEGRRASDPKRSPWGLVQHYLRELSKTKPTLKAKPTQAPTVIPEGETLAAEEVFAWVDML